MKKQNLLLLVMLFITVGLFSPAGATLWDRGDGLIYDDYLNITWIQDVSLAGTTMTWDEAMAWTDALVYQGYDDWRLPSALNQDGTGPCSGYPCDDSELGHLLLIDSAIIFDNFHGFMSAYWTSTEYDADTAWAFGTDPINQNIADKSGATCVLDDCITIINFYAWAVRDGDSGTVSPIPEPSTMLLLASGMIGLLIFRRRLDRNSVKVMEN